MSGCVGTGRGGALALERFEEAEDGRIAYRMKRPLPDGTTHLLFTGMELLRRLAGLVPPSRNVIGASAGDYDGWGCVVQRDAAPKNVAKEMPGWFAKLFGQR